MSEYLGFQPTDRPDYFFVSYNSEDKDRVSALAKQLSYANVPLWYDYGLEYGEEWEKQISGKIKDAEAVLLFFTKGILEKENSYVRKEYEMATKYFGRKVYVVMMDTVENCDVPFDKVPWWIDIQAHQSVHVVGKREDEAVAAITDALGITAHEEKMNQLILRYRSLYETGETEAAERFLNEFLHGQKLAGKAQLLANIICGGIPGSVIGTQATEFDHTEDASILNKIGINGKSFYECAQIKIKGKMVTVINEMLGANPSGPDPHVIRIWRDDEMIHAAYGPRNAVDLHATYDALDDVLFVTFSSSAPSHGSAVSVITVENPAGEAVCNVFRHICSER